MRGEIGVVLGIVLATVLVISPFAATASPPPRINAAPSPDLRVGFLQPVESLNPYQGYSEASLFLYGLLYDYPFSFDQNGTMVGSVITSASCAVANCSAWNYTVRQGIFWSDGTTLTASDVNFTWNYDSQHLLDLYAFEPYFNHVVVCDGSNAGRCGAIPSSSNPWNVTLYFDMPFVAGTDLMAPIIQMAQWVNVTPSCAQGNLGCGTGVYENPMPIGTGPFTAAPNIYNEWLQRPTVPLHLIRNARYHAVGNRTPTISIANLYVYTYNDANSMASALLAGSLDVAQFTAASIGAVSGKPNVQVQTDLMAVPTWNYIGITQIDALDPDRRLNPTRWDIDVRRALAMATNKDYIVLQFYNGYGVPGSTLISPVTPAYWYDPVAGGDNLTFNVAAANALLNVSGYTTWSGGSFGNGFREATNSITVSFQTACLRCENPVNKTKTIPTGTMLAFTIAVRPPSLFPEDYSTALYLQAQYAQIGVQLIVLAESSETNFVTDVYGGNVEMYIWFWSGDPDPNYLISLQSSWTLDGWNDNYWNNATYNHAYLSELGERDLVQRQVDVKAAQKVNYDLAPYIITVYPFGTWAMRTDRWQGWGDWGAHPYRQLNVPWGANPLFFDLNCPSCAPVSPVAPPTAPSLAPAGPVSAGVNQSMTFNATSTDANASVQLNFTWYWGDGSTTNHVVSSATPKDDATHAWAYAGTYVVAVQVYDGYNAPVWSANNVTLDVEATGWLSGTVEGVAGQRAYGATVTASPGGFQGATNGTGVYNLSLPSGVYTVSAAAPFWKPASKANVTVTSGQTTVLNFVLAPGDGWLNGTVVNAATGAPLAGVIVDITFGAAFSLQETTDVQGRFNASLHPGEYTVTLSASGYLTNSQPGVAVTSNTTTFLDVPLHPTPNPIVVGLWSVMGRPGVALTLYANATTPAAGTWRMDFGDGSNVTGTHGSGFSNLTQTHAYASQANYTVTLNVTSYLMSGQATSRAVVDGTPPVTYATVYGVAAVPGWYRAPVTVVLYAYDWISGMPRAQYSLDGGAFQNYTGSITISNDGNHTLRYRSTDRVGNVESTHVLSIGIDTTPPSLQLTAPAGGTTITSSEVVVSWSGSDALSGIARYAVQVDGGPQQSVGMDASFAASLADGPHTITVWAFDLVGNNVSKSITFQVDTNIFSPSGPYAGLPTYAIIVAAVAVAAIVLWIRRKRKPPASRGDEGRT